MMRDASSLGENKGCDTQGMCFLGGGQKRIKTNKFLKIIRDASSVPNQYIPYTQKK